MVNRIVFVRNMNEVQEFNRICSKFSCDVDLIQGRYTVDAKSIMGIFSLNLSEKLNLTVHTEDDLKVDEAFSKFITE